MIYRWSIDDLPKCLDLVIVSPLNYFKLSTWSVGETELNSLNPKISEDLRSTFTHRSPGKDRTGPSPALSIANGRHLDPQSPKHVKLTVSAKDCMMPREHQRTSKNVATSDFLIPNLHLRYLSCLEISEKFLASPLPSSCCCLCFPRNPWASRLRLRRMAGCAHLAWPLAPCVTKSRMVRFCAKFQSESGRSW
jgi:hypothetical protein